MPRAGAAEEVGVRVHGEIHELTGDVTGSLYFGRPQARLHRVSAAQPIGSSQAMASLNANDQLGEKTRGRPGRGRSSRPGRRSSRSANATC
jgi:hypothetical protein